MASSNNSQAPSQSQFQLPTTHPDGKRKKNKHLTCNYWTRGECRYTEAECKYAHNWTDLARGELYIPQGARRRSFFPTLGTEESLTLINGKGQGLGGSSHHNTLQQPTSSTPAPKESLTTISNPQNTTRGSFASQPGSTIYSVHRAVYPSTTAGTTAGNPGLRWPLTTTNLRHHLASSSNSISNKRTPSGHSLQMSKPAGKNSSPRLNPNAPSFEPILPTPESRRSDGPSERTTAPSNSVQIPIHVLRKMSEVVEHAPGELRLIARDIRRLVGELRSGQANEKLVRDRLARYAADIERLEGMTDECREALHHIEETS